jgi:hypothetical protein
MACAFVTTVMGGRAGDRRLALGQVSRLDGVPPRPLRRKVMDRDLNETLEHIRTLVKAASESDDIEVVRKHLAMVRVIFDKVTAPDAIERDQ